MVREAQVAQKWQFFCHWESSFILRRSYERAENCRSLLQKIMVWHKIFSTNCSTVLQDYDRCTTIKKLCLALWHWIRSAQKNACNGKEVSTHTKLRVWVLSLTMKASSRCAASWRIHYFHKIENILYSRQKDTDWQNWFCTWTDMLVHS
jgi:hypothetical protein